MADRSEPQFAVDPDRALRLYRERGFHVERRVMGTDRCAEIRKASRALSTYKNGNLKPIMMPHRHEPEFERALKTPGIVTVMERLVNGRVSGLQTQFFFGRPGTVGFTAHQDNHYIRSDKDAFASAWLALDAVDAENGCLVVYPGTHREPLLPVREVEQASTFGQDPNANVRETALPEGYSGVDVAVGEGDVVFIHGHLVHKSRDNVSKNRYRHVLLMTYLRSGVPFRPGLSAKRAEIDVY